MTLVLFSPHPDDIAISMGAFAALAATSGLETRVVLVTDGSESLIPSNVLSPHGWTPEMPPQHQRELRGRVRVAEAVEEVVRLGFDASSVRLLRNQRWFTGHRTPAEFMHPDLSLRDAARFQPGPVDDEAAREIRDAIGNDEDTICAAPDPNDRLRMHRIVTELVQRGCGQARMLTYECLSTIGVTGPQILFGFGGELMAAKRHAILAHHSMAERRRQFGGYSNPGTEFYDEIVARNNAALAQAHGLEFPFAERYGWPGPVGLAPSSATGE